MYQPPHSYAPQQPVRRWWQRTAVIITALVLFPPAGIALAWMSGWNQNKKIISTVLSGAWLLILMFSDSPDKKPADDAKPPVAATSSAPQSSAPAAAAPSAAAGPVMPSVLGMSFAGAERSVEALIDTELTARSAYTDVTLPADHTKWVVCFQEPGAGAALTSKSVSASVHLIAPGTTCPADKGTVLRPKSTPKPTPTPTAKPTPKPTADNGDSGSTSGGSGSVGTIRPGAFCSPAGAKGTYNGKVYTCKGPDENRWRQ